MGVLEWVMRAVGRDLDRRVHGAAGTAQGRFPALRDDQEVVCRAVVAGSGPVTVKIAPAEGESRTESGRDRVQAALGRGEELRGGAVTIEAEPRGTAGELAALTVELTQGNARETFSVEGRFGGDGRASLAVRVTLG